jgi:hypothetical protein
MEAVGGLDPGPSSASRLTPAQSSPTAFVARGSRSRRRSDRIEIHFAAVQESAFGTKRHFAAPQNLSAFGLKRTTADFGPGWFVRL